ncbi:hypothetical protein [Variovorax sp. UC122_21]|uniref:hypothetical protein n=1 Tax=Variovorax sp. UC122_21 TaxID=3374554 RepID=UPI003757CAEF
MTLARRVQILNRMVHSDAAAPPAPVALDAVFAALADSTRRAVLRPWASAASA